MVALGAWLARDRLPFGDRPVPRLETDGQYGLKAVDDSGRVLWNRADIRGSEAATVVRTGAAGPRVAALVVPGLLFALAEGERWDEAEEAVDRFDAAVRDASLAAF